MMMQRFILTCRSGGPAVSVLALVVGFLALVRPVSAESLASAPWPASDGLGRVMPTHEKTGGPRPDRYVGIFYFVWLGAHSTNGPFDLSQILAQPSPKLGPPGAFHHWGEPELGYYYSRDPFVLRRHATQLADAGVDFIAIDVTNGFTYEREVDALCETWIKMRAEGNRTPRIIFLTNSRHEQTVAKLFERIYKPGLYRELWFEWQGKPLLMANPEGLPAEVADFFTLRRSWAWSKGHKWFGDGRERWPWLDHSPQTPGWREPGKPEQMPVVIAEHPISNIGRSHEDGVQPPPEQQRSHEGLLFQEQWNHAREVDPEVVFVTGWNEWVAQRFTKKAGKAPGKLLGKPLQEGDSYFVDAYNIEFSRDAEPMAGGYGDAYYYQMVANIRYFKGAPPLPAAGATARFSDTSHDTAHRDHEGWAKRRLTETSGRNDIIGCRTDWTGGGVSFSVETREALTEAEDGCWMLLFIDADQDAGTGWQGYDYVVNRSRPEPGKASLEKLDRAGKAHPHSTVPMSVSAKGLKVTVPGLARSSERKSFDFHISDNAPLGEGFFQVGDHAPNRRFNYRFTRP